MTSNQHNQQLMFAAAQRLRSNWPAFLVTYIVTSLAGYTLLLPLLTGLFQLSLSLAGQGALSDQEILFFALSPAGMIVLLLVGSLGLLVIVWKHAALMVIAYGAEHNCPTTAAGAMMFVLRNSHQVMRLAARIIVRILLIVIPYLLLLYVLYTFLLTDYDINFYLSSKPWQFWLCAGLAIVATIMLLTLVLQTLISWFYALPLILFSGTAPATALTLSSRTSNTWRRRLIFAILFWLIVAGSLLGLGTLVINALGQYLIPSRLNDMQALALALGVLLLLSGLVTVLVQALNGALLAILMIRLYRSAGLDTRSTKTRQTLMETRSRGPIKALLVIAPVVIASFFALWLSKTFVESFSSEDHTHIIAHRGASGTAPENTLAAVRLALTEGADWIEIDVQETADGEVVVVHDSDLKKVAGVDLKIWEATLAELSDIDIGSWFGPGFSEERVPTLRQVLELCRSQAGVVVELKYYGHNVDLEQRVASIIEEAQMVENIRIMSLDNEGLVRMRALRPNWPIGLLTSITAGKLTKLDLDFYAINARLARRHFINEAHASGRSVMVWTVNDVVSLSKMIGRGVDGVITDYPAMAREVLQQRAKLTPPERLLIELATWFGHEPKYLTQ